MCGGVAARRRSRPGGTWQAGCRSSVAAQGATGIETFTIERRDVGGYFFTRLMRRGWRTLPPRGSGGPAAWSTANGVCRCQVPQSRSRFAWACLRRHFWAVCRGRLVAGPWKPTRRGGASRFTDGFTGGGLFAGTAAALPPGSKQDRLPAAVSGSTCRRRVLPGEAWTERRGGLLRSPRRQGTRPRGAADCRSPLGISGTFWRHAIGRPAFHEASTCLVRALPFG